jgi:hypothetical protein
LSLVVGNGVAKLPDQVFPPFLSHRWFQPINNRNVSGFGFLVPFRGFCDQFLHPLQVVTKLLRFLLVLIGAAGIAAGFGPFAHVDRVTSTQPTLIWRCGSNKSRIVQIVPAIPAAIAVVQRHLFSD